MSASPVSCLLTLAKVLMKRGSGKSSARSGSGSFSFKVCHILGTSARSLSYSGDSH
jgi:hypothetical protein